MTDFKPTTTTSSDTTDLTKSTYERFTEDWHNCRTLLNSQGHSG
jgi:hypothetical protein